MGFRIHEQADGNGYGMRSRTWLKRLKRRTERRRAKSNPECQPMYTRYRGYLL